MVLLNDCQTGTVCLIMDDMNNRFVTSPLNDVVKVFEVPEVNENGWRLKNLMRGMCAYRSIHGP